MLNRLTMLQIHIIGFFMALIALGLLFYFVIKPQQEKLTATKAQETDLLTTQHGNEDAQRKRDLEDAKKDEIRIKNEWRQASAEYMPDLPLNPDVLLAYQNTFAQLPRRWGTWLTSWYDVQRPAGIARLPGTEFAIPAVVREPNQISSLKTITFPSEGNKWNVSVEAKSFGALMNHLRSFNRTLKKHGMPVVDNVALSGQSPNLIGTYTLALYAILPETGLPKPDDKIGVIGSAGAGGGRPGGFGAGRFGGSPIGPGGGPGGSFGGFSGGPAGSGGATTGRGRPMAGMEQ